MVERWIRWPRGKEPSPDAREVRVFRDGRLVAIVWLKSCAALVSNA